MISKKDLLIRMGEIVPFEQLCDEVEKLLITAASTGGHSVVYEVPKKATKQDIDSLYVYLAQLGYDTDGVGSQAYKRIVISW